MDFGSIADVMRQRAERLFRVMRNGSCDVLVASSATNDNGIEEKSYTPANVIRACVWRMSSTREQLVEGRPTSVAFYVVTIPQFVNNAAQTIDEKDRLKLSKTYIENGVQFNASAITLGIVAVKDLQGVTYEVTAVELKDLNEPSD